MSETISVSQARDLIANIRGIATFLTEDELGQIMSVLLNATSRMEREGVVDDA